MRAGAGLAWLDIFRMPFVAGAAAAEAGEAECAEDAGACRTVATGSDAVGTGDATGLIGWGAAGRAWDDPGNERDGAPVLSKSTFVPASALVPMTILEMPNGSRLGISLQDLSEGRKAGFQSCAPGADLGAAESPQAACAA